MSNSDMFHEPQQTGTTSLVIDYAFHVTFRNYLQKRLTTIFDTVVTKQERRYI